MLLTLRPARLSVSILVSVLACADSSDGFVLLPSLLAETDVQTTTTPEMPRDSEHKWMVAHGFLGFVGVMFLQRLVRIGPGFNELAVPAEDW